MKYKIQNTHTKNASKHVRNLEKSTLFIQRLNLGRELKSIPSGREFHEFTTRSLKKLALVRERWGFLNITIQRYRQTDIQTSCS